VSILAKYSPISGCSINKRKEEVMTETTNDQNTNNSNVSEKWLEKFELLKKIGADEKFIYSAMKSSDFKELSSKERHKITFNWLAFIFAPLYYFSKKMWFKGAVILGSTWLLNGIFSLMELALGFTLPAVIFWIIPAAICATLADYDYFKFVTEEEKIWKGLPEIFSNPIGAVGYLVVSFIFLLLTNTPGVFNSGVPECGSSEATGLVVEISKGEIAKQAGAKAANSFDLAVSAIRTTSINEQTGSYHCSAQLNMAGPNGNSSLPITYTVEITDNGEEFYVNVFGL
jgi:Protein of unknown function (DUF2628)